MLPDADLPNWLTWLLLAGAAATALLAIAGLAVKTGRGMGWLRDSAREAIADVAREALAEIVEDKVIVVVDERIATAVEDLEAKLAPELSQLAPNGGETVRDRVVAMQRDLGQLTREFRSHVAYAERKRPEPGDMYDEPSGD